MKIGEITAVLEQFAPLAYQEEYDNSGYITGKGDTVCTGVLLSLDCTEEVVDEAISQSCNLIVSHHPIVFSGLKKITGSDYVERTLIKAIRNDIAIYACHTNIDNVVNGVNRKIAEKLGLVNLRILSPKSGILKKLVTFVPSSHHEQVLQALFTAGAGCIGHYDSCSFNLEGEGTFRGDKESNPFTGTPGVLSREKEIRLEVLFERGIQPAVISALLAHHPYESVAYDLYSLDNTDPQVGSGIMGEFETPYEEQAFAGHVKKTFGTGILKHTRYTGRAIRKVAVCGGSGRFLLKNAIRAGADAFITADFKYHEYFDADGRLLLLDVGHYESEQFTPEIFYDIIRKKFPTFAIRLSKINTNPINYL